MDWKERIKRFGGGLAKYEISKPAIVLFSTRRSGSTMLTQMIFSQPGIDYVDQPLDLGANFEALHAHASLVPRVPYSKFTNARDPEILSKLEVFFRKLTTGEIRVRNNWNPWRRYFNWKVNRVVIKELSANPLIGWFADTFDLPIVYLVRHPIPVALSIRDRGWPATACAFLDDPQFCQSHLNSDQVEFGRKILASGTWLENYVLEWCLENLVPLSEQNPKWLCVTYEELVERGEQMAELLCDRLMLEDRELVMQAAGISSRNASDRMRTELGSQPTELLSRWMKKISVDELSAAQRVMDAFGVGLYTANSPYPRASSCHFSAKRSPK